jgi:uncharacterized membrane protein
VHNTYFTLPVLFAMLSNHYSMTYSAPNNWLVLALIMLAGALIRQFFVLKHKGKRDYKFFAMGAALPAAVAIWIAPSPRSSTSGEAATQKFAEVKVIVEQRCQMCHNAQVFSEHSASHPRTDHQERPGDVPAGGGCAGDADGQLNPDDGQ